MVTSLGHIRKLDKAWTSGRLLEVPGKDFNCNKQLNHVGGMVAWERGGFVFVAANDSTVIRVLFNC